jgi:hypothetical protein
VNEQSTRVGRLGSKSWGAPQTRTDVDFSNRRRVPPEWCPALLDDHGSGAVNGRDSRITILVPVCSSRLDCPQNREGADGEGLPLNTKS